MSCARTAYVFYVFTVGLWADGALACDDLADNLLKNMLQAAIQQIGCSGLKEVGVDKPDHNVESICYNSNGPTSTIEVNLSLRCHTGDRATIPVSISEKAKVYAEVQGKNCTVQKVDVSPSGEIGKLAVAAFEAAGKARTALQNELNVRCGKK